MRDHHVEAGEHGVTRFDAMHRASAHVGDQHPVGRVAHVDAGRIEADTHVVRSQIEQIVIERRQHDVLHRAPGRDAGNKRAHQKPRERGVAVGKMIDVGLAAAAR